MKDSKLTDLDLDVQNAIDRIPNNGNNVLLYISGSIEDESLESTVAYLGSDLTIIETIASAMLDNSDLKDFIILAAMTYAENNQDELINI